jgi:hypothetical protein
MKVFKIRDKNTGLFSTGGCQPDFNKEGKTWMSIGHIKNHLHQFIRTIYNNDWSTHKEENRIPEEWEVIEYERTETEITSLKAKTLITI